MIVGIDVSSHAIHLAWVEAGKPCRWHQDLAKGHLIDRLRSIQIIWPHLRNGASDVTEIAIEMPFGQSRSSIGALMAVVGIVTKQAPPWARVAWPSSGELRAAIGAPRNNKVSAHAALRLGLYFQGSPSILLDWDEHELDALTACIGWTRILEGQGEWP